MNNQNVLPNFLYIGTSKAGSTWIYKLLCHNSTIYMAPGKGTYFFDQHYDRGIAWYKSQFGAATDAQVRGEISHGYLYSAEACERIAEILPDSRLMVCLREPVDRAFSSYLDQVKNGKFNGTFEQALDDLPLLTERGRYAKYLAPYLSRFGRERIHVGVFDELKTAPEEFARRIIRFLDIDELELPSSLMRKQMPAAGPRSRTIAQAAKKASRFAGRIGLHGLRGRVKRSALIRNLLYRPYTPETKPTMKTETHRRLQEEFRDEVCGLDELLGTDFRTLWKYK